MSQSLSKEAQRIPDESELMVTTVEKLKVICAKNGINIKGATRKADIIARILGASPSGEPSARSSSVPRALEAGEMGYSAISSSPPGGGVAVAPHYTQTVGAKGEPGKGRSASAPPTTARGGDDPVDQLNDERERRVAEWKRVVGDNHPWKNLGTLQHIFNTKMMPRSPNKVENPTLVILVGPAASGKSSALERVNLGLTDHNTVRVDPDKIYEWLADKYGYFPPEIKEITDPEQYSGESPEKYRQRCADNLVRLTKQNADRLAWWLENEPTFNDLYHTALPDDKPRSVEASEFCTPKTAGVLGQYGRSVLPRMENMIFNGATAEGRELNVLLDTTGGMEEGFLERMAERFKNAGYKVVVVLVVSSVEDCMTRVSGPDGRNTQQHRKLDKFTVGRIWRDFVDKDTSCRWERFSRENRNDFVVVQNTWTQSYKSGRASVVYRRDPTGKIDSDIPPKELAEILRTYDVRTDDAGGFVCRSAAGSAGSAASKRSHSKGHGGSSRKRRISRRRIHGSRYRKTIKKYARRPVTRRRHRI